MIRRHTPVRLVLPALMLFSLSFLGASRPIAAASHASETMSLEPSHAESVDMIVRAAHNGGCSKDTPILNSRVQVCISRPLPRVVAPDAYVSVTSPSPCDKCRQFRLILFQDLPFGFDRAWKVLNFPYRSGYLSLGRVNVERGRYYTELWVMENGVWRGGVLSPLQDVY